MNQAVQTEKIKLACYWACGCGGCDVSILDTDERILDLAEAADIVFWPIAVDSKKSDVEAMPDGGIDLCFFNGSIRNTENTEMARLLRRKSKILVAFGTCAHIGGVHGLLNTTDADTVKDTVFAGVPSVDNPEKIMPGEVTETLYGKLELPRLYDSVYTLGDVVEVDYYIPGCPPAVSQVCDVIDVCLAGTLPEKGTVLGACDKAMCDECLRNPGEAAVAGRKVERFTRPHMTKLDEETCFLDQGVVCMGPVTRSGCGEQCVRGNMPCRGCYGPTPGTVDTGGAMTGVLAGLIESESIDGMKDISGGLADPLGTMYLFSMARSLLRNVRRK